MSMDSEGKRKRNGVTEERVLTGTRSCIAKGYWIDLLSRENMRWKGEMKTWIYRERNMLASAQ